MVHLSTDNCTHIWHLEPADGPNSWGRCRQCGQKRLFQNSVPDPTKAGNATKQERAEAQRVAQGRKRYQQSVLSLGGYREI